MPTRTAPLILIADDEADIALVTGARLEAAGYRVQTAPDGEVALRLFRERKPDLVLLDLRMPRIDGYQFCKIVKTDPESRHVPIILFSASSSYARDLKEKCMALGADGYIRKPFTSKVLLGEVRRVLADDREPAPPKETS